jgi:hypothetical protein
MYPRRLLLVPMLLAVSGCFAVPGPYRPDAKLDASGALPDVRTAVGSAKSDRPLRVGVSTRADVEKLMGDPAASADGRVCVYAQQMFSGYGAVLPPFYGASGPLRQKTYFLRVAFDDQGVLRGQRVEPWESRDAGMGYMISGPDRVPDQLLSP